MIAALLRPLLAFDGLVAVMVLTRDGLPVELIGHGLQADQLAAEVASVGETARGCCEALGLGAPEQLELRLEKYRVKLFSLEQHYLAIICAGGNEAVISQIISNIKPQLRKALGGS